MVHEDVSPGLGIRLKKGNPRPEKGVLRGRSRRQPPDERTADGVQRRRRDGVRPRHREQKVSFGGAQRDQRLGADGLDPLPFPFTALPRPDQTSRAGLLCHRGEPVEILPGDGLRAGATMPAPALRRPGHRAEKAPRRFPTVVSSPGSRIRQRRSGLSMPNRSIASRHASRGKGRGIACPASSQSATRTDSTTERTSSCVTNDASRSIWVNSGWRSARRSSSQTPRNLEIAVEPRHHEQLFVDLG